MDKAPEAFRTISEVADEIDVPQHVLRFWESRFTQIRPMKRGGGRRYYRPDDVDLLRGVRHLLYGEGYTIRGVQRILRDEGAAFVQDVWRAGAVAAPTERCSRDPGAGYWRRPIGAGPFVVFTGPVRRGSRRVRRGFGRTSPTGTGANRRRQPSRARLGDREHAARRAGRARRLPSADRCRLGGERSG